MENKKGEVQKFYLTFAFTKAILITIISDVTHLQLNYIQ